MILSKLIPFADDKWNVSKMMKFAPQKVDDIYKKKKKNLVESQIVQTGDYLAEGLSVTYFIHKLLSAFSGKVCTFIFVGWSVVLGFNATLTAKVISWQSVTQMCFLSFSHQY